MDAQAQKIETVRRYYDQNTPLFLSLGSSPKTLSIHRAVWAEGTRTLEEALDYTNSLILGETEALAKQSDSEQLRILDLGCGVGGSLFYLLEHLDRPATAVGLTISPVQARIATETAAQKVLSQSCLFLEADFQAVPLAPGAQLVYSVEAFIHAPNPGGYFEGVSRLLQTGGRLILCDDFLAGPAAQGQATRAEQAWLDAYLEGWQVNSLYPLEDVQRMASACQLELVRAQDLTPCLRLRLLPGGLASLLLKMGRRLHLKHAMLPSMLGSLALQHCLHMGLVRYRFLVFEKRG
ncbi:MAG TPA: methyltransferase domain-containing protein [Anaerolineales bacterium]|nr:methyltransferase domain-containing protein [Anaerolineales bacterium]